MRGLLIPSMRKAYLLGGHATFTLVDTLSGLRYTYKVKESDKNPTTQKTVWFVSVLIGPDNWTNYKYAGLLNPESLEFFSTKNSKIAFDAPSVFMLRHFLSGIETDSTSFEMWHEGSCAICGRKLTVPESIASGIGPVCASR